MRYRRSGAVAGLTFLAVAIVGVTLIAGRPAWTFAQRGPGPGPGGAMMSGEALAQLRGDAFDRAFLQSMIMHHTMAVVMARPVAERAAHVEARALAAAIVAGQSDEIATMRDRLKEWYGVDMPDMVAMMDAMVAGQTPGSGMMPGLGRGMPGHQTAGMPMAGMHGAGGMGAMAGMSRMGMMLDLLDLPPARLEAVFMSTMVPHHQDAIAMARLAPDRAAHAEITNLASGIITSQSEEIDRMTAWLAAWYGL